MLRGAGLLRRAEALALALQRHGEGGLLLRGHLLRLGRRPLRARGERERGLQLLLKPRPLPLAVPAPVSARVAARRRAMGQRGRRRRRRARGELGGTQKRGGAQSPLGGAQLGGEHRDAQLQLAPLERALPQLLLEGGAQRLRLLGRGQG